MAKDTTTENAGAQGNRVTSLLELKNVAAYRTTLDGGDVRVLEEMFGVGVRM